MLRHDHECIQAEWDCALVEDCSSFDMHRMTVRTDQLLHIATATDSQIYTRDSEAETHGWAKTLLLSLKQYHGHYYHFYEKRMTRALRGLQGLHLSDVFRCSNVSFTVGLKSLCPWCFRLGGNTEMIAPHLREVQYQLAINCDIFKSFASMSAQSILEHCSGCKAKYAKECREQEGHEAKSHTRKSQRCGAGKSLLKLVQVALMNSAGQKDVWPPSFQFCWWIWVDPPLKSSKVVLTMCSEWIFTKLYKLLCFCFK